MSSQGHNVKGAVRNGKRVGGQFLAVAKTPAEEPPVASRRSSVLNHPASIGHMNHMVDGGASGGDVQHWVDDVVDGKHPASGSPIELTDIERFKAVSINHDIDRMIDDAKAGRHVSVDDVVGQIDRLQSNIERRLDDGVGGGGWYDVLYDRDTPDGWEAKTFPRLDELRDAQFEAERPYR